MGAIYDSGMYDADDLSNAYAEGYKAAAHTVSLVIHLCCPRCSTCISTLSQQLGHKLVLFLDTQCCPYCEIRVTPSITIGTAKSVCPQTYAPCST
jgi:hypothetical protein